MANFHEVLFPLSISSASKGGPTRRTDVVTLRSGAEQRNSIWADSLRKYDAGPGVKTLEALQQVVAFFEERRGQLYGFRWRDISDCFSSLPGNVPAAADQGLGTGNGTTATWQLVKTYGGAFDPWVRTISKPVAGTVRVAVGGSAVPNGTAWTVDTTTGLVTFLPSHIPPAGAPITAGYQFDVPVRLATDVLEYVLMPKFNASLSIPIVELRL